jgi:hypothetical protein
MSELKSGDNFPEDVKFTYIPPTPEASDITACGIPTAYDASKGMFLSPLFSSWFGSWRLVSSKEM